MLYHSSPIKGLEVLEPRVSTHKKPYVYAVDNAVMSLIFGAKHDDFDFIINEENGSPAVYECYPDAFCANFRGKQCSLYEVEDEGFLSGMTSWSAEYVCENCVSVVREMQIEDLYSYLLECAQSGKLALHMYEQTSAYRKMISSHIVDRLIRFEINLDDCLNWEDERFRTHYAQLIGALNRIFSGDYLY